MIGRLRSDRETCAIVISRDPEPSPCAQCLIYRVAGAPLVDQPHPNRVILVTQAAYVPILGNVWASRKTSFWWSLFGSVFGRHL